MNAAAITSGRRYDTFFVRLFILMWVTLVVSHAAAYFTLMFYLQRTQTNGPRIGLGMPLPTFPSLPPGNPFDPRDRGPGGPPGNPPGMDAPMRGDRGPADRPHGPPPGPSRFEGHADNADDARDFGSGPPALPVPLLWLDYGVRLIVMALGAALGARWLATPMRRVSTAASSLSTSFGRGTLPQGIDEHRGSIEVRDTARAFNSMATRLQQQYDARGLQMASVSHDLRTPLARLRLRLERLGDDPVVLKAVGDIHEMDEMIDATLAVLREQQEGAGASVVDVSALVQSMVDDLVDQGQKARFDEAPPMRVRAHPAALRRIIGNLIGNAIRYGGNARVGLHLTPEGLMVTIDDDGPGIPDAQISRAFEPWVRLGREADSNNARSGHGLGLAIARDLAQRDGGDVTLENRPLGGLRVTLRLVVA